MKSILTAIFVYTFCCSNAQNKPPEELHFNQLNIENGLPENSAFEILKDKLGYVWVGTQNGLVRFDGYNAKKYELIRNKEIAFINFLYEDRQQRFWTGTDSGLYQYDYAKDAFIYLDIIPGKPRSDILIYTIKIDDAENIWINFFDRIAQVTSLGCYNIISKEFSIYNKKQTGRFYVNFNDINDFIITNTNTIFIATENGLFKYESAKKFFKRYTFPSGVTSIRKLYWNVVSPDDLWITIGDYLNGQQKGIGCYNVTTNNLHVFSHSKKDSTSLLSDTAYGILTDSKKQLWISSTKGLSVFHPSSKSFSNYIYPVVEKPSAKNLINKAHENKDGCFWFVLNEGLLFFDTHNYRFTKYLHNEKNKDGLIRNDILSFLVDDNETVWAGGWLWGLQWINKSKSKFTVYKKQPSALHYFPGGEVNSFAEDDSGNVFISSKNGLYKWRASSDSFAKINFTLSNGKTVPTQYIIKDKDNLLWIVAYNDRENIKGLYCYDSKTGKARNYRYLENDMNSISGNNISYLYEDKNGIIWIGVEKRGLCSYDKHKKKFKRYPYGDYFFKPGLISDSLDQDQVRCITSDKDGSLWVGTNLGGINQYFTASEKFLSYKNKLPGLFSIMSCYCDNKNRIWAGTFDAGFFCFDKENNRLHKYNTGSLYNGVNGIAEDADNNLWLASPRGFTIFNTEKHTVKTITKNNGLPESPLNILFKMKDGRMIYPCEDGFVLFNPADYKPDTTSPIVHIETIIVNKPKSKNISVDSTIVCYDKHNIELKHDENRITFNYVGLIYQNVEDVRYKYKLDNYDNSWINSNKQRTVTYTNLSPGTYTFHVTAANSDGKWNKKGDVITVTILPPFWQTWWFRTLLVLVVAGLIFLAVKMYLNRKLQAQQREFEKQQAIEKVRSKISMDIHDEISSGLTKISLLSQRIKTRFENNKEIEAETIDKIAGSSKEVINNLGEIIRAVNPKHDNLQSLLAYIRNYAFNFFEQTSVQLNINFPDEISSITISPDIKHNLFLTIKEALNNIIKHANASIVDLNFTHNDQSYSFTINDNGKGIDDLNGRVFGNGLTNMKNRINAINGTISFKSGKDKGTMLLIEGKFI